MNEKRRYRDRAFDSHPVQDCPLFSLQGLRNLDPTLRRWRGDWKKRVDNWTDSAFALPVGRMLPLGYILMQHSERLSRPAKAYKKWADRIPSTYQQSVLNESMTPNTEFSDENCLARLKHYRSLVPMAQEVRKPIFQLTTADGAIGSHSYAVKDAWNDFHMLARAILGRIEHS